jgi:hypothetical protein
MLQAGHFDMRNHCFLSLHMPWFVLDCEKSLKPAVGMTFDSLDQVKKKSTRCMHMNVVLQFV